MTTISIQILNLQARCTSYHPTNNDKALKVSQCRCQCLW